MAGSLGGIRDKGYGTYVVGRRLVMYVYKYVDYDGEDM